MTVLQQVEQAPIDAAAPGWARRRWGAVFAIAIAVTVAVVLLALSPADGDSDERAGVLPAVPESTLAKAEAYAAVLASGLAQESKQLDEAALTAFARHLLDVLPYPPDRSDDTLLALTGRLARARNMSQISVARDLRMMSEYRAACVWQQFWVAAHDAGDQRAQASATAVLQTVPRWPSSSTYQDQFAAAAREGDAATLKRQVAINCSAMGGLTASRSTLKSGSALRGGSGSAAGRRPR